jgi:hypothetical protein
MKSIKLYRIVLNMLFYIFYILLASIAFSFIFPTILVILWKNIWIASDPRFTTIQIAIIILVLVFSLIFRKYFYLPIREKSNINKTETKKVIVKEEIKKDNSTELDIKIGKEIK